MGDIKKQYGLMTGMSLVIGIVIGSGVFIKAGGVLRLSGGDLKISLLAWFIGGLIMITSGFSFAVFASKIEKFNGVIDYIEYTTNRKTGYILAWIFTTLYYPIIASIVSLFAGGYFFKMVGLDYGLTSLPNFIFAFVLLTLIVILNYFSPLISSKLQISTTVIKLIPIFVIALMGLFASLIVGEDYGVMAAFTNKAQGYEVNFGEAIKKTAFAYEGWVCATAINAELKDSKKNLPKALCFGTILILIFYLVYYISVSAFLGNANTITEDANAPIAVFVSFLGKAGGVIFSFFILMSCLGTVNGVMISCTRGMYTISSRGLGPKPELFSKILKNRSMSFCSCLYGYVSCILMLLIWYLAMHEVWLFKHLGSIDEIVCAIIYSIYIFMYVHIMKHFKELNIMKRFVMPICAIIGSIFFTICGTGIFQFVTTKKTDSLIDFLIFLVLFIIITIPAFFFYKEEKDKINNELNN